MAIIGSNLEDVVGTCQEAFSTLSGSASDIALQGVTGQKQCCFKMTQLRREFRAWVQAAGPNELFGRGHAEELAPKQNTFCDLNRRL